LEDLRHLKYEQQLLQHTEELLLLCHLLLVYLLQVFPVDLLRQVLVLLLQTR